jgi:RNA recognition motif-containing protein
MRGIKGESSMAKNLFVGSLPFAVTEDTLGQLFSQHGQVVSVNIIKDKYSGQSRGFGFVEMGTDEEAQKAITALNGHNLDGRSIVVKEALPRPDYNQNRGGSSDRKGFSDRRNKRQ